VTSRELHHGSKQAPAPSPDGTTHTSDTLGAAPATFPEREPHSIPAAELRDPERYKILGEHGRGGLGRVSRAHDRDLGRDIAIKELISGGHVREMRFVREALITARLEHPGIVPVYEAGRWPDGTPFYAMKLVAGRSLRELLAERETLEERISLLHHVIAVADAIAYAHDRNIIHRDLKPANVIVGDFGETIVIDWGLAKDLTAAEDTAVDGGPFRSSGDDGLTSTGSVLGTPAYMAPEQLRGEPVDQRADVHAIGAMLWELCTSRKLPPGYTGQRGGLLRRAGIDGDLVSIIEKSLDPDPDRRYPHAGALAADLKAFKAGARISARRYSLFALLAHRMKQHRALAVSLLVGTVLASAGIVMYMRRIAAERDRVSAMNGTLILEKARLLLRNDPTAAFDALEDYRGTDLQRLELLRAEARGLGVARLRATPHTQLVGFVQPVNGHAVVTLAYDGHVVKTSLDGTSRILTDGVPQKYAFDYAESRALFAFACPSTKICLLDLRTERLVAPPATIAANPAQLALSRSGRLLAAMSDLGEIALWQLPDGGAPVLQLQAHVSRGRSLTFADDGTLVTQSGDSVRIFHLEASGRSVTPPIELSTSEISDMSANADLHVIALGDTTGELTLIDSRSAQIVDHASICKGAVNRVVVLPSRGAIAYTCQDGDIGTWIIASKSSKVHAHLDGGASAVVASADGRYLMAGGNAGAFIIHDFTTGSSRRYLGHASRIVAASPPTPEFPYAVSADSSGEVRVWRLPDAGIETAITMATRMFGAARLESNGTMIAIGNSSLVSWRTADGTPGQSDGHVPAHSGLAASTTRPEAVFYGRDDELELWTFDGQPVRRTLHTGHGEVRTVLYRHDGATFIVACKDGTLEEWANGGTSSRVLGTIGEPIDIVIRMRTSESVLVAGVSGMLWALGPSGMRYLGLAPNSFATAALSPDDRWLAVASQQGIVHLYNLSTLAVLTFRSPHESNEWLLFSPDGTKLAIATRKTISLITVPASSSGSPALDDRPWSWNEVELAIHTVFFSPDNEWFAATGDRGGMWFNRRGDDRWVYLSTGANRVLLSSFSADGTHFIATDAGGRALSIDMRASTFTRRKE
jgi:eukaryotic-like serine/threonine-protein kinase